MNFSWIDILCSVLAGRKIGKHAGAPSQRGGSRVISARIAVAVCGLNQLNAYLRPALPVAAGVALLALAALPFPAFSATPVQGDRIINSATLSSPDIATVSASVSVAIVLRTNSTIEFLQYAPGVSGAVATTVPSTYYRSGSDFIALPTPSSVWTQQPIDLNSVPLLPTGIIHGGEPLFIRVTDRDQNLDRTLAETILVTVKDPLTNVLEVLRLTESGLDTGVFIGYLPTSTVAGQVGEGVLSVVPGSSVSARYVDVVDGSDSSTDAVLVDPFGIVFDSQTGEPVNDATVTLIKCTSLTKCSGSDAQPAVVFGDDGVSAYPSTITSGSNQYNSPAGGFRFPFLTPGFYKLQIAPPPAYSDKPSTVATESLLALGPFAILDPGSRGEPFTITVGPAIRVDIPVDPLKGALWLRKTAGKGIVAAGDFLPYDLVVETTDLVAGAAVVSIVDTLPPGFRYQKGSTKINGGSAADPVVSADGRTLTFTIGAMAAKASNNIRYVVAVGAGAAPGQAVNSAIATNGQAVKSNIATATVQVQEAFLRSRSILMGRVIAGSCAETADEAPFGVEGVGIYLEDGTVVLSDKRGMFHFEGIRPGVHVVQLDLDSLPEGYEVVPCEKNTRFAGRAYSQFVDVQGGTMWRVDFHAARKGKLARSATGEAGAGNETVGESALKGDVTLELSSKLEGHNVGYVVQLRGKAGLLANQRLTVTLPDGVAYQPGSSRLDNQPLVEPDSNGTTLTYHLDNSTGDWSREVRFLATVDAKVTKGELLTRAVLTFNTPSGTDIPTPAADNILAFTRDESAYPLPPFILYPHFPTFGAELNADDRQMLDDLARLLMVLKPESIDVSGYTDNVRIAPRSRKVYQNNVELSRARAKSVGNYLREALHLTPDKFTFAGMGEAKPIGDNRTAQGRALNRRVEVRVTANRVLETSRLETVKERSGLQKVEIAAPFLAGSEAVEVEKQGEPAAEEKKTPSASPNSIQEKEGLLFPQEASSIATRISSVRVCVPTQLKPRLLLDGKEVPGDRIGFTLSDPVSGKSIYSYIGVDLGDPGEHLLLIQGLDPFGNARFESRAKFARTGEIATIRLLSAEGNVADGKTPVKLRLQFFDVAGKPINAAAELEVKEGTLRPVATDPLVVTTSHAVTVQVDAAGWVSFQPVHTSGPYHVLLAANKVTLVAETYVKPKMRDWILVGLAEGTVGYSAVSGHMENLQASGSEEDLYKDGRVALYAKGTIKGEWLLTMAYDSAKSRGSVGNSLFQTIDPNSYYTLYGDGAQQSYDAASARKLYLKIERDQFYALFGDFDTGMTVTELSRYSRRLNGVKTELQSKNVEFNLFGSETSQAFVKDELLGDGTSGLYHLSRRNIVLNSEKIAVETRDRFRSEVVISSRILSRFMDYSIDYDAGTIFFKEPIHSKDENFNPVYIVVDYEANDNGDQSMTYGGRAGLKLLDQKIKAGVSYIHEGQVGGKGNLYGFDTTLQLSDTTQLRGEMAGTETDFGGDRKNGTAYLVELAHTGKQFDSKLYVREQDEKFGLGQQKGSEAGTRKFGFDTAYRFTDHVSVSGQGYRQYNLLNGAERDMAEAQAKYTEKSYSMQFGVRQASDNMGDGSVNRSTLLNVGGSLNLLEDRLTLRVTHDQAVANNKNADFPTRTILGADYKLTTAVTLFAAQEFTFGAQENTQSTVLGVKSTPWKGGQLSSSVSQQNSENGGRVFANLGLMQKWQVTDKWSVDGGLDRSQTLKHPGNYQFNANVPPASGSNNDFTAVSLGGTYTEQKWSWANRIEYRISDTETKWGGFSGVVGEVREGIATSGRLQIFRTEGVAGNDKTNADLRFGLAYRPKLSRWILLDRLDLMYDRDITPGSDLQSRRFVNNLNANWKPNRQTQLSLQYGAKYVLETIDGSDYSGYTDLCGAELRYDLGKDWDIGLHGSILHSWNAGQADYGAGASIGYNVAQNAWISLGYNLTGFTDKDFSEANFTAKGPFVRFRFKFDQNSVKDAAVWLNRS